MSKLNGRTSLVVPVLVVGLSAVGLTTASASFGEFTTRVPEGRLFINGGRILRCDLFFTAPGMKPAVAPKGTEVQQVVPPVVWQYSGLLPVSDYLKTVAIHSVATDEQLRPWQEVQGLFYNGLRAEGATDTNAKIAYAGAYAFAPRWTLVEFVEVVEEEVLHPNSVLFQVEYSQPNMKGMSIEDYRTLALEILSRPDSVSLGEIRSVVDTADESKSKLAERASLGGIGDPVIVSTPKADMLEEVVGMQGIKTNTGSLMQQDKRMVASSMDPILAGSGEEVAESELPLEQGTVVIMPEMTLNQEVTTELMAKPETSESEAPAYSDLENAKLLGDTEELVIDKVIMSSGDLFTSNELLVGGKAMRPTEELSVVNEEMTTDKMIMSSDKLLASDDIGIMPTEEFPLANEEMAKEEVASEDMASEEMVSEETAGEVLVSDQVLMTTDELFTSSGEILVVSDIPGIVLEIPVQEMNEQTQIAVSTDSMELNGSEEEWIILSDGSMVLRSIEKLVSE